MDKIWYIRHGQSESNLRGIFAGGSDNTPLTRKGKQQAHKAGLSLKNKSINKIITSPLARTHETAKIIARAINLAETNIILDERFKEYDLGTGSGLPIKGMTAEKMTSFPGAENPNVFANRVKAALSELKNENGTTLVVAHGGVGRLIHCLKAGINPALFYSAEPYPNAHAVELDLSWLNENN